MLNAYQRARILLLCASVICFVLFWWTSRTFDFPIVSGLGASIALHPGGAGFFLALVAAFFVCLLIGTVLSGIIRFNAGLVAACIGLSAVSIRGGGLRQVLFNTIESRTPQEIFHHLAMETALLGLLIGAGWYLIRLLYLRGVIRDREEHPVLANSDIPSGNEPPALAIQTLVTGIVVLLVAATAARFQALAAVAIGSFAGALLAQYFFPTPTYGWYWLPPFIVGAIGYIIASFDHSGITIGELNGHLAALARPLPLDYASAGPAGAILAHWLARAWQREAIEEEMASPPAP